MILDQLGGPNVTTKVLTAEERQKRLEWHNVKTWPLTPTTTCEHQGRDHTSGYKPDFPAQPAEECSPIDTVGWPAWPRSDLWPAGLWLLCLQQWKRLHSLLALLLVPLQGKGRQQNLLLPSGQIILLSPGANSSVNKHYYWEAFWVWSTLAGIKNHTHTPHPLLLFFS